MIKKLTAPSPIADCSIASPKVKAGPSLDLFARELENTPQFGDGSWAIRIRPSTLEGPDDAPTFVKWVAHGPYLIEVRLGTSGLEKNAEVNETLLNLLAKTAYDRAKKHLP